MKTVIPYYEKGFVNSLKINFPLPKVLPLKKPVSKEVTVLVGRVEIEQRFLMRIGMLSNCNVSIHQITKAGYVDNRFLLSCGHCEGSETFDNSILVMKENLLAAKIEEFCTAHRHDARAQEIVGRKFREDG